MENDVTIGGQEPKERVGCRRHFAYEPGRMLLPAPDVRDWLPEGHLRITSATWLDGLDLTAFTRRMKETVGATPRMSLG